MADIISRDQNHVTTLAGVTDDANLAVTMLRVDPVTKRLLVSATGSGSGSVTSVSVVTANGLSGTVATPTTTPAITLNISGLDASKIADGSVSSTEFQYLDGVTSSIQTQINSKGTGTVTSVSVATANGFSGTVANATTTPAITIIAGVINPTTVNGLTISSTTGTLTITNAKTLSVSDSITLANASIVFANGKTLGVSNSVTIAGTDSTVMTFPTTSATVARTDAGQTFTGVQVMTSPKFITQISDTNGNILINIGATASAVNYIKVTNAATGTAGPIISADGETNVDLKIAAKGTGKIHRTTGVYGDITAYSPSGAGTATLTLNTANIHTITMPAGNITIALSNEGVGQCFIINIIQDSGGSRTVTWFTTIKWAGGSAPTLTTTANKIDTLGFIVSSGGNYYGYVVGQNI